jgi:cyanate lyase
LLRPLAPHGSAWIDHRCGDDVELLQSIPVRGGVGTPSDPTLYRFHSMMNIYGPTLKALVHEKFGDGIISAINFRLDIQKVADPEGGDRAVITLNGKFLPVKPYWFVPTSGGRSSSA